MLIFLNAVCLCEYNFMYYKMYPKFVYKSHIKHQHIQITVYVVQSTRKLYKYVFF
jgi:membrane-bound metal-dependent hydrolase YbcI (DUF457 family)